MPDTKQRQPSCGVHAPPMGGAGPLRSPFPCRDRTSVDTVLAPRSRQLREAEEQMIVNCRRRSLRMLVGAFACVCFLLQQLLVPLHLALNDHGPPSGPGKSASSLAEHSHTSDGHRHGLWPSRQGDSNEDHQSHPVEDHLAQIAEPAVLPTLVSIAIAPTSPAPAWRLFDPPVQEHLQYEERGPRPPPPRSSGGSRAPPICA